MAVGNIIGASIANLTGSFSLGLLARPITILREDRPLAAVTVALTLLTAVLGLSALATPLVVDASTRTFDLPFLVDITLVVTLLMLRGAVGRLAGATLLGLYITYLYVNFWVKG